MRYLLKKPQCFTPWLVHPYVNKGPLQWLSRILQSRSDVNVETNKLDLPQKFNMRYDFPALY